ncbi:MAG: hypothetical protein U0792_14830 [Gemmataceae bacterium]
MLERAAVRVRARVMPHTWEAFRLLAVEGLQARKSRSNSVRTSVLLIVARSAVRMICEELAKPAPAGDGE